LWRNVYKLYIFLIRVLKRKQIISSINSSNTIFYLPPSPCSFKGASSTKQKVYFDMPKFTERVRKVVAEIPKGETLTYGQVAALAGSPGAARAVGNIMKGNYNKGIPCHRVVRSDGKMGGYNRGGISVKLIKLEQENAV